MDQKTANSLFDYRGGFLYWKERASQRTKKGSLAGCLNINGYWHITIKGKCNKAHRLIFLMHQGYLPEQIDHIDGNPSNNKIENLRECTNTQNQYNMKMRSSNTSGVKGVYWNKTFGKWHARIAKDGKRHHVGFFKNIFDAACAMYSTRNKMHGDFTNHGLHLGG